MRIGFRSCVLIAYSAAAPVLPQTPDPTQVRFSAVTMPPQSLRLDSTRGGLRYFSGELTYDLAAPYDSVPVHVYFEEVAAPRTFFIYQEGEPGRARFVRIDSLSEGDLGRVKPKAGCRVRWRYATANPRNHCRLKVGISNLEYLVASSYTESNGTGAQRDYAYNRLGLPARFTVGSTVGTYSYNLHGFPLFTPPYTWYRYDSLSRRIYTQVGQGAILQAIFGYAYDSLSRLSEIRNLPPGYSMDAPGPPFNREVFRLDGKNRVVYRETHLKAVQFACNPQFGFEGADKSWTWYHDAPDGGKIDSTVNEYHDSTRAPPLLLRVTTLTRRQRDSTPVEALETWTGFDTAPGSCFAPSFDNQTRYEYRLDARGHAAKTVVWIKTAGATDFRSVDTLCSPREYDAAGRVIRSFQSCEDSVGMSWTYDPYGFAAESNDGMVKQRYERRLYDLDTLEAFATMPIGLAALPAPGSENTTNLSGAPMAKAATRASVTAASPAETPPGYGISGYFSLDGGVSAIRKGPGSDPWVRHLDVRLSGAGVRVKAPPGRGGEIAVRLADARGRTLRTWSESLPAGGEVILRIGPGQRGLQFLCIDGGELGRAVRFIPPMGLGAQ